MKRIMGIVNGKDGGKGFWTKIGVAFENKDGSMNLKFEYLPTSAETTIQLRDFEKKEPDERPSEAPTTTAPVADSEIPF